MKGGSEYPTERVSNWDQIKILFFFFQLLGLGIVVSQCRLEFEEVVVGSVPCFIVNEMLEAVLDLQILVASVSSLSGFVESGIIGFAFFSPLPHNTVVSQIAGKLDVLWPGYLGLAKVLEHLVVSEKIEGSNQANER